jgi:hypothetical protein
MRVPAGLLLCLVTQAWTVNANVEKTIFLGPDPVTLPHVGPSLDDLRLHALSHAQTILPTQLAVQFPSKAAPHGLESWYILEHLEAGRRYEVRICWPATVRARQPRHMVPTSCVFQLYAEGVSTMANILSNLPTSG